MKKTVPFLILAMMFAICACQPEPAPEHQHTFSTQWTYDDADHWHAATCGHEEVSDKASHVWDEGRVTTSKTCTTAGVMTYTCTVCQKTREEVIAPSHSFGPATELGNGVQSMTCTSCGHVEFIVPEGTVLVTLLNPAFGDPSYVGAATGTAVNLPVPTNSDYLFLDWNTSSDGLGSSYVNSGTFYKNTTLYARWTLPLASAGPAGGYVFYDCDADNATGNADGLVSTQCGWRYLEAAPEDLKIGSTEKFMFGFYRTSSDGDNLYLNGTTTWTDDCTGTAIGTGKANTAMLVNAMGTAAYSEQTGTSTTAQYAAKLADDYVYGGYDDWFLPSKDELGLLYDNFQSLVLCGFVSDHYWSSSESYYANQSWLRSFNAGTHGSALRNMEFRVRFVRAFTPIEQLDPSSIYLAETIQPTCKAPGWKVYKYVATDKEACRVLDKEPTGHILGSDGYHCYSCGRLMSETGIIGPAGGYVFYDCDEDNEKGNADGLISTECGWRYLEAAPKDVDFSIFGYFRRSSDTVNFFVNQLHFFTEQCTGTAIGTGKANTAKLVGAMGSAAYLNTTGSDTINQYAAKFADDYVYAGFDDWFLPSKDELNLMYEKLCKSGIGDFSYFYWSSSEYSESAEKAWRQYFEGDVQESRDRSEMGNIRCIRAF